MGKEVTESVVATIEVPTEAAKEVEIKQEVGLVETRAKEMIISTPFPECSSACLHLRR